MSSTTAKAKAKTKALPLSDQGMYLAVASEIHSEPNQLEIQQIYVRLQNELQALARKIGELESEADEHAFVFSILHLAKFLTDVACTVWSFLH